MRNLNAIVPSAILCATTLLLAGCGTPRHLTYHPARLHTQPTAEDLRHADLHREALPEQLWLAPTQVHVEPAPGRVLVTVTDIQDLAMQDSITLKVKDINAQYPLHPIWLDFK